LRLLAIGFRVSSSERRREGRTDGSTGYRSAQPLEHWNI
jgi:hypothetical protein